MTQTTEIAEYNSGTPNNKKNTNEKIIFDGNNEKNQITIKTPTNVHKINQNYNENMDNHYDIDAERKSKMSYPSLKSVLDQYKVEVNAFDFNSNTQSQSNYTPSVFAKVREAHAHANAQALPDEKYKNSIEISIREHKKTSQSTCSNNPFNHKQLNIEDLLNSQDLFSNPISHVKDGKPVSDPFAEFY
jgi:hypothetical protein